MIAELELAATIAASGPAAPAATSGAPACDLDAMRNERAENLQPSIDSAAYFAGVLTLQESEVWRRWQVWWGRYIT